MKKIGWYLSISVYSFIIIFPFLWMISTALKPSTEVFSLSPTLLPKNFTFSSFIEVIRMESLRKYAWNSFVVAMSTTVVSVLLASLAGYGFSRFRFHGRDVLLVGFLCAQMIPSVILLMPIFGVVTQLQLLDSYPGLILANITFTLPYCTWIMTAFFRGIPQELEEAAWVDGASRWQSFRSIILPLAIPGIISAAIFSFILSWDEFVFALTLTRSEEMRTLPYGLYSFMSQYGVDWNNLMAASIIAIIPPLLLFIFLQRYFLKGMLTGAVNK
jgi:multiple sugar transport system permease protein